MPVQDGVGYGELTELKLQHLHKIFGMHLAVTRAVLRKPYHFLQQYRYLDLTAGKGLLPNSLVGSPLIFLEQAEGLSDFSYRADFVESISDNLVTLKSNVKAEALKHGWECSNLHFHNGQYEQTIPHLFQEIDTRELGLIFVDPSGEAPSLDALKYVSEKRPRMEILIYISTTNLKRVQHITGQRLSDYMQQVGKKHWLIRKPISWDSHKWTFLLGSNTNIFKDYKKIDFLRLDSEEAQEFYPKLELTEKQRTELVQPRLL